MVDLGRQFSTLCWYQIQHFLGTKLFLGISRQVLSELHGAAAALLERLNAAPPADEGIVTFRDEGLLICRE